MSKVYQILNLYGLIAITITFSACNLDEGPPTIPEFYEISVLSGKDLIGFAGKPLSDSIVVLVKNERGRVAERQEVSFSNQLETLMTNRDGIVSFEWVLGNSFGEQTLEINLPSVDSCLNCPLSLTATSKVDCPDFFTDPRDNRVYPAVRIGDQCWMTKNLNYGIFTRDSILPKNSNGITEKYCYDDNQDLCDRLGGWYSWDEAMQGENPVHPAQGICPDGWHIPSQGAWDSLFIHLGVEPDLISNAVTSIPDCQYAEMLKVRDKWCDEPCVEPLCNTCNNCRGSSGLNVRASGHWFDNMQWITYTTRAMFWSSTKNNLSETPYAYGILDHLLYRNPSWPKERYTHVRCIKN